MAPTEIIPHGILISHQLPATLPCSPCPSTPEQSKVSSQAKSRTIVVRGFFPWAYVYPSKPLLTSPSSIHTGNITAANSTDGQMLAIGGASGDDPTTRFGFGDSSEEDENSLPSTRSVLVDSTQQPLKKQTSLKEDHNTFKKEQAFIGDVFEMAEGDIEESTFDDDDDPSDWEDLVEDSRDLRTEKIFQRVDTRSNLTSRQSMITLLLHGQPCNANALANTAAAMKPASALQRSVRTSRNGPSLAVSPKSEDNLPLIMKDSLQPISEVPRSQPQPITPTQGLALSPRSTRKNMLESELTAQTSWARYGHPEANTGESVYRSKSG
ncbi:uncharacterized protein RCO7_10330 [Rhynchosporium graminicola]|uniref:DUF3295 domain-containing protein n=1 Tax=Rhynchosporium graminicola TaxID=2792576 RepID=A0A1E1K873_9HELO|nr:uncharacterized protein RCO7_10330 [Rhynchosporium commune]